MIEPSQDFDWESLEDAEELCQEELEEIIKANGMRDRITPNIAKAVLIWGARRGTGSETAMLEVAAAWISGLKETRDMPLRSAVFIYMFSRVARQSLSMRAIANIYGVSHGMVSKLATNLRHSLLGSGNDGWCSTRKQHGGGLEGGSG